MSAPPQFLIELSTCQFLSMAGQTILTYDYFLTVDLEVDYIWNAPWTAVKVVFLLNRYGTLIGKSVLTLDELGLLSHGSREFCANFQWFQSIFVLLSSETTRVLLLLRAWALWRCSYRAAISLVSVYVFYVLVISGYSSYIIFTYSAYFDFPYLDETGACVVLSVASTVWLLGLASLLLDTGVFAMVAYYLYKLCRPSQQLQFSPLVRLLVRDAFLFYVVNVLYDVLSIVGLSMLTNDPRYYVLIAFAFPLLTVTGQRVVLNLRRLRSHSYATEDINRDVDRQIAAMQHRSFWQSVDVWMNDPHLELGLNEGPMRRHRTTRTTESQITEEDGSYELDVIRTHVGSRYTDSDAHYAPYDPLVHVNR